MKEYDKELLRSLVEQGLTNRKIAEKMGLTQTQVQYRITADGLVGIRREGEDPTQRKPREPKPKPKEKPKGSNGDRKKCKTCKWRARYPASFCNYGAFHKFSRSHYCTADNCTVYEKGKPMKEKPS